jgi:putative hemolysin
VDSSVTLEVVIILALITANGLFALSEMALVSARKARLRPRAEAGNAAAQAALDLAEQPARFLSAVQVGITLVGILAGAFGGARIAQPLAERLAATPALAPYSQPIALGLVVLVITYLTLVIGELAPKQIALNSPERIAMLVARPINLLVKITAPVVAVLTASTNLLLKLLRVRPPEGPPVTEEEILILLEQATDAGVFHEAEEDLVSGVFRLGDLRAASLMTPRTEMTWLDLQDDPATTRDKIIASPLNQYAVKDGDPDNVAGVVRSRDLLADCVAGQPLDLRAVLHPPLFLPETSPATDVMRSFLSTGDNLCFVIDEYGGMQGIVTSDALVRAIAGDMEALGPAMKPKAIQRPDGSWLVDGLISIEEFKDVFDLVTLPDEDLNAYETLGGFAMAQLGRIPMTADRFTWGSLTFEVVDMDGRRVDKLLVTREG